MKWIASAENLKPLKLFVSFVMYDTFDFMLIIQQLTYCKRTIRLKQKMREQRLKQSKGVLMNTHTDDNKYHQTWK